MTSRRAVFLDRDGVIVENRREYIKSWEEVEFLPGAYEALRRLNQTDYVIVLVTNQSVVGRGIITLEQAIAINAQLIVEIRANGGRIDAAYLCPHRPDENCRCRKPAPEMFLKAAQEHDLALTESYVIGDALSDVTAADAVGAQGILVLTGRGGEQKLLQSEPVRYLPVVADLGAAVLHIANLSPASHSTYVVANSVHCADGLAKSGSDLSTKTYPE